MKGDRGVNDLLQDLSFRKWVLHQDTEAGSFWENWVLENPEKKETVALARIMLKSLQFDEKELSEEESYQLLKRIKETNATRDKTNDRGAIVRPISSRVEQLQYQQNRRKSSMRNLMRYAAVLAGALVFALSVHLWSGYWKKEAEVQLVEKVNRKGQKAILFLSDGSKVMLNAASTLRYPKEFEGNIREVYLEGEAFFEVSESSRPFIVRTNQLAVRVLGTSFNVNASSDTREHAVSLVTGKVELHPADGNQQYLILSPGEKGKVSSAAGGLVKASFDYEEEIAWKEGVLLFKDIPLAEALNRIEKWYGVEFSTADLPLQDYHVTGRFDNESLGNVLLSISFTTKINYKIEGNKIILTSQR